MKEMLFKITALAENKIKNKDVIIAVLSNASKIFVGNQLTIKTNLTNDYVFVLEPNSILAKEMYNATDRFISLSLDDFLVKNINFEEIDNQFGYIEKGFLNQFIIDLNKEVVKRSVTECLLRHNVENIFADIFFKVLYKDYFDKSIDSENIDIEEANRKYVDVISVVLNEICKVVITDVLKGISEEEKNQIKEDYKFVVNYGYDCARKISSYVLNNKDVLDISLDILKDSKYSFQYYIKEVFSEGYSIARNRISKNLIKKTFFGHELVFSNKFTVLKIFPTPYNYLNLKITKVLFQSGKFDDLLDSYMLDFDFFRVKDNSIVEVLKTKFIFKHKEIVGLFYYKPKETNLDVDHIGRQDNNPYNGFLNEKQINLILTTDFV